MTLEEESSLLGLESVAEVEATSDRSPQLMRERNDCTKEGEIRFSAEGLVVETLVLALLEGISTICGGDDDRWLISTVLVRRRLFLFSCNTTIRTRCVLESSAVAVSSMQCSLD